MKICSICGASCGDSAGFCLNCGMKLPDHTSQDVASSEIKDHEEESVADDVLQEETDLHLNLPEDNTAEPYPEQQVVKSFVNSNRILMILLIVLSAIAILGFVATKFGGTRQSTDAEYEAVYPEDTQEPTADYDSEEANDELIIPAQDNNSSEPFYGIWCAAYLTEAEANSLVSSMQAQNLPGEVIVTSEWENLNPTRYYVVTSGRYYSESDANAALDNVRYYYPDAYVKFTGANLG